mgnify:FL=1
MFNILIIEDEPLIADHIEYYVRSFFKDSLHKLKQCHSIESAKFELFESPYDLVLLDLNLNGKDGFDILHLAVSGSFQTIIITAHKAEAVRAFEYGVLDFITKPFNEQRFFKSLQRFSDCSKASQTHTKYLSFRNHLNIVELIELSGIYYIQGAGTHSKIKLKAEEKLHDKNLEKLLLVLPSYFIRIHKSFIVNKQWVVGFENFGSGKIELILQNDIRLPVSRTKFKELKHTLFI